MIRPAFFAIEPLEARIAPALTVLNPIADIVAGAGKTGMTIDLGTVFDSTANPHTIVKFVTNFDSDPNTPGVQGDILIELFDDTAPLTVQNFLRYVTSTNLRGDYDGTIFHRAAFLNANTSTPIPFVLQGGGFEATSPGTHIPVGVPVHNEFDASRSNLAGTLAMAKTGLSKDSATSEFFFNLGDNSTNLDNQNGGFTVFGKVIAGMNVVNAIANSPRGDFTGAGSSAAGALPNINSAFGDLPVGSGYNIDPDNNLATPPPKLKASDYISIVDAMVVKPANITKEGLGFSVVSIVNTLTDAASDLVTATLTGDTLGLKFANTKSGVAKVTLQATLNGEMVQESFTVTLKPNLIADITANSLPTISVPSDTGTVKLKLSNNGGVSAKGNVEVKFYISQLLNDADPNTDDPTKDDPNGTRFQADLDVLAGSKTFAVDIKSGGSTTVTAKVKIPESLTKGQGAVYRIIAVVQPVAGAPISELFTDDNVGLSANTHILYNIFGTFNSETVGLTTFPAPAKYLRKNVPMTYTDALGHPVKLTLTGGGTGQLLVEDVASDTVPVVHHDEYDVRTFNTNINSVLTAKVGSLGAHTSLRNVFSVQNSGTPADQIPIGTVNFGTVDVHGQVEFHGGVKSLTLGNLQAATTTQSIQIGKVFLNPTLPTRMNFGSVTNYGLESKAPVASLRVLGWSNVNVAPDTSLRAVSLANFASTGNFEASLYVADPAGAKTASFTVGGTLLNAVVSFQANVGQVKLGAMKGSLFYVGVTANKTPTSEFQLLPRTIDNFVVKNLAGMPNLFQDSQIVANTINALSLQSVDFSTLNEGSLGVVARAISNYVREGVHIPIPKLAGSYDVHDKFSVRIF